jgi:D-lyxose ketol-isomerase
MQRSEVNAILAHAIELFARHKFYLPPFAHWTPDEWQQRAASARHAIDTRMGWDLTDFGLDDFMAKGILLFTVRNGLLADLKRGDGLVYCEKIMITRADQLCPMHRHLMKTEDIINRAGDTPATRLALKLYRTTPDGDLDRNASVPVLLDGVSAELDAGSTVRLAAGESITLFPGVFHAFWAEGGDVMIGEVSTVNDDAADNFFHEPVARFPAVSEDEAPLRLLVSDYARVFGR